MHPAYHSDKPGVAPDCGMRLEAVYADSPVSSGVAQIPADSVTIDADQQQLFGIRVVPVENAASTHTLRVAGRIVADDTRLYRVTAGVEGWVRSTQDDSVGTQVKKDQLLAVFYSSELLTAESGYIAASERGTAVGPEHATGGVTKETARSVQNYIDRLHNLGMGDAQISRLSKTKQLPESIDVTSPVDGFITARNISSGQRFERGLELYRIADLRHVWVLADLYEDEARYARPGSLARITLPNSGRTLKARVSSVLPQVDPETRTLKVRLEADNSAYELRPDMFVNVELPIVLPAALTVPADALLDSGLHHHVFVQSADGSFSPREVKTGWRYGDRVQITGGLKPGERVVASATFLVDSESRLHTAPSTHAADVPAATQMTLRHSGHHASTARQEASDD
jgi:Cu(I)/Ag(I) efflux system membrane fusion protein